MSPAPTPISFPLRILLLSPPSIPLPSLLKDPTLTLSTPYYTATIPIWHDNLPVSSSTLTSPGLSDQDLENAKEIAPTGSEELSIGKWEEEWSLPEAGEVIRALGAVVVGFRKPISKEEMNSIKTLLTTLHRVLASHQTPFSSKEEPLLLALGLPQHLSPRLEISVEEWEDLCRECGGWEWIDEEAQPPPGGRNEYGGECSCKSEGEVIADFALGDFLEKVGMQRMKEALEANEWEAGDDDDNEEEDNEIREFLFGDSEEAVEVDEDEEFGPDQVVVSEASISGMKSALLHKDDDDDDGQGTPKDAKEVEEKGGDIKVEELESMMLKMQAIKDMGADMPKAEREKFAAKAVRDVMKTM